MFPLTDKETEALGRASPMVMQPALKPESSSLGVPAPSSSSSFLTALLSYHLHTIRFAHGKYTVHSVGFSVRRVALTSPSVLEHFHHLAKKPCVL